MILNSKNNQYVFRFPKGFIYPDLEEKYNFYLKRIPTPFESITDYVNHTIQSVTFPSVSSEVVEQYVGRQIDTDTRRGLTKNPQQWRESVDFEKAISKEFTINFKLADGYLNYWVLYETYIKYLEYTNMEDYMPDLNLAYLDRDGYELLKILYRQPLISNISELEMNYAATAMEFRTFSMGIKYNIFEIDVNLI